MPVLITNAVKKRFWDKVNKTKTCWVWMGAKFSGTSDYGRIQIDKKRYLAHRISYTIKHGRIPKGLCILHKCDNPVCVRPSHLYIGTHKQNMLDRKNRVRGYKPKGENHGLSKLTNRKVLKIRKELKQGKTQQSIADKYEVHQMTISFISRGLTWRHV